MTPDPVDGRSRDIVPILDWRSETLGEFVVACDEGTLIGVHQGTGRVGCRT